MDPTSPASSALSETAGCFDQAHHARTRSAAAVICPAMRSRPFFISCGPVGNLPRPVHARLSPQPASPVSGVLFPGGGESPTFPQVRLGCPSLWSAISGISALAGRVSGSGLWWRFSNFRFGGAETGSTADSVDAVFRPVLGPVSGGCFRISGIFAPPRLRPVRNERRLGSHGPW